jgi:hypothetical protein
MVVCPLARLVLCSTHVLPSGVRAHVRHCRGPHVHIVHEPPPALSTIDAYDDASMMRDGNRW